MWSTTAGCATDYLAPELRTEFSVRQRDLRDNDPKAAVRAGASDPSMPLDPTFRVEFFWIIARLNNCYYCLGHQEVKLKAAGVSDDSLAALDTDWSVFTPAERGAFAFVRKLGRLPQEITAADVDRLREHYNDLQILDIIFSTAGFASMTRWTGGLMIPQEEHRVYLTPTSEKYRDRPSVVAPLDPSKIGTTSGFCARPRRIGRRWSRAPRSNRNSPPPAPAPLACRWSRRIKPVPCCPATGPPVRCRSGSGSWPTSRRRVRRGSSVSTPRATRDRSTTPSAPDRLDRCPAGSRLVRPGARSPAPP